MKVQPIIESTKKNIFLILVLTVVVRIFAIFILKFNVNPNIWEYHDIALNILSGKGYSYEHLNTVYFFYISPFYCWWSALMYFLTNKNYLIIEIIQACIAGLSVILLIKISKELFDNKVAALCGFLYAIHPGFVVYSIKLHEFIFIHLVMLTLFYMIIKRVNIFLIGSLIGLGFYLRAIFVFFIPVFFVNSILKKENFKLALSKSMILVMLLILIVSPWVYRGYRIYNRFILRTDSAQAFWQANNPFASGSSNLTADNKEIFSIVPEAFKRKVLSMNEIEQYDFFKKQALAYIVLYPKKFACNMFKKFYYFWWFSPQSGLWYPHSWLLIYRFFYFFIILFFVWGLYYMFKNRKDIFKQILFLLFFVFMVALLHSVTYIEIRHRWMIEPIIIMISSYGILVRSQKRI